MRLPDDRCQPWRMRTDTSVRLGSAIGSFVWLVVLPAASSVAGWVEMFGPHDLDSRTTVWLSLVPLLGLVVVLVGAWATRNWRCLVPFIPFAIGAMALVISWWDLRADYILEPDGAPIPIVAFSAALLLPVLALAGGVTSWQVLRDPRAQA